MNERIREFALEARIAYYSKNGAYEGSDEGLSVIPSTQSLEKFAELIVRECMDIISDESEKVSDEWRCKDGKHIWWKIKEHFGVEE